MTGDFKTSQAMLGLELFKKESNYPALGKGIHFQLH